MSEIHNIADYLFERRATNLNPAWLADLFGRLVWLMDDNGDEIGEALYRWLKSKDQDRIAVALAFDEFLLFKSREEMEEELNRIRSLYPDLRTNCDELLNGWKSHWSKAGIERKA